MSLKAKLEAGQAVVGPSLGLRSPDAAELMSQAGYDFLLVDAEHSDVGIAQRRNRERRCYGAFACIRGKAAQTPGGHPQGLHSGHCARQTSH